MLQSGSRIVFNGRLIDLVETEQLQLSPEQKQDIQIQDMFC
jgi:hypothetical protein